MFYLQIFQPYRQHKSAEHSAVVDATSVLVKQNEQHGKHVRIYGLAWKILKNVGMIHRELRSSVENFTAYCASVPPALVVRIQLWCFALQ